MEKRLLLLFVVALVLFETFLGARHVGSSMLLGDQLDQLRQFAELIQQGKPQALYGPWMSGTNPIAYNIGPIYSMSLGLLSALGFNPDLCHAFCVLVIIASVACLTMVIGSGTHRERCFAVVLAGFVVATAAFQQNFAFIWVNNWLPAACMFTVASMLACVRRPSLDGVLRTAAVWILGMHLHSAAAVGLPLVAAAAFSLWLNRGKQDLDKRLHATTWILLAVACLPYVVGELWSGFSNTRAMIQHVRRHDQAPGHVFGRDNSIASLQQMGIYLDNLLETHFEWIWLWVAGFYMVARVTAAAKAVRHRRQDGLDYLWLCFPACLFMQVAYQYLVNRPLTSFHYFIYLNVFYWLPWADMLTLVLSALLRKRPAVQFAGALGFGTALALMPLWHLPPVDNGGFAFKPMLATVTALCENQGPVRGFNSLGFENGLGLQYHTNVVEYLIKEHTHCQFDASAPTMIVSRLPSTGPFPKTMDVDGKSFDFVESKPPGIALYRAAKGGGA